MMHDSAHNRKVALARWNTVRKREKAQMLTGDAATLARVTICGFLAGDGSICARTYKNTPRYDIRCYPDDLAMLGAYLSAFETIYHKLPKVSWRDNVFQAAITSRTVGEDVLQQARFGIHRWTVPTGLFGVPGTKEAWLRAFFSAEAYVGKRTVRVQTVNPEGMRQVSALLTELGISHHTYRYVPKRPTYSPVSIINIGPKRARRRFFERIGFWHAKKTYALAQSLGL